MLVNKDDFPIFRNYPKLVYLDSAATSQKPETVLNAITGFYSTSNANVHRGIYELAEKSTTTYETARKKVAAFFNVENDEIVFNSGTTNSANLDCFGRIKQELDNESVLVSSMAEHHSNLIPLQQLTQESGASLQFVGVEQEDYNLDYASLENILANEGNKVKAIVLSAVSNVLGYKLDLCRVIELRNKYCEEAILAIDAAQLVGHEPFFPKDLGLDFVYFSAHKALGPMGIGVLWGRKEHLEKMSPIQFGGGMISRVQADRSDWNAVPARFEAGTPNVAGAVALAAALDYLLNIGLSNIKQYLSELTDYLYENLANRDDILIHCPNNSQTRGALLSFSHRKLHPHDLAQALDEYKVAVRAGQHCTQILHEEVLRLPGTVRTSLHVYNSQADINRLIQALDESETIRALS